MPRPTSEREAEWEREVAERFAGIELIPCRPPFAHQSGAGDCPSCRLSRGEITFEPAGDLTRGDVPAAAVEALAAELDARCKCYARTHPNHAHDCAIRATEAAELVRALLATPAPAAAHPTNEGEAADG